MPRDRCPSTAAFAAMRVRFSPSVAVVKAVSFLCEGDVGCPVAPRERSEGLTRPPPAVVHVPPPPRDEAACRIRALCGASPRPVRDTPVSRLAAPGLRAGVLRRTRPTSGFSPDQRRPWGSLKMGATMPPARSRHDRNLLSSPCRRCAPGRFSAPSLPESPHRKSSAAACLRRRATGPVVTGRGGARKVANDQPIGSSTSPMARRFVIVGSKAKRRRQSCIASGFTPIATAAAS